MARPTFWLAAVQIMGINILLSGDNAVVIALAVRGLPPKERFWGMVLGAGAAAVLLILFTGIVATLMQAALSQARRRARAVLGRHQAGDAAAA